MSYSVNSNTNTSNTNTNTNSNAHNPSNSSSNHKYPVYRNDIKFRKYQNIDPSKAVWTNDVEKDYKEKDTDGIDYRVDESIREKYELLDLSHMSSDCLIKLSTHKDYPKIKKHLKHLFITSCELKSMIDLDGFEVLETLDVNGNELEQLPKLPKSLLELVVYDNKLIEINNNLPLLKRLKAYNNKIKTIYFGKELESISIKNNPIETIPSLDKLYYLDISFTGIKVLPNFPKVRILDCSSTMITTLNKMESLRILICNDSKLEDISKLVDLEELEMIRSKINNIHYMEKLFIILYKAGDDIRLSKKYKISKVKKNQRDIMEIILERQ